MGGECKKHGQMNAWTALVGKLKGRHADMGGYIEMDVKEIGLGVVDWVTLVQDCDRLRTLVNTVMKLHLLLKTWNLLTL